MESFGEFWRVLGFWNFLKFKLDNFGEFWRVRTIRSIGNLLLYDWSNWSNKFFYGVFLWCVFMECMESFYGQFLWRVFVDSFLWEVFMQNFYREQLNFQQYVLNVSTNNYIFFVNPYCY